MVVYKKSHQASCWCWNDIQVWGLCSDLRNIRCACVTALGWLIVGLSKAYGNSPGISQQLVKTFPGSAYPQCNTRARKHDRQGWTQHQRPCWSKSSNQHDEIFSFSGYLRNYTYTHRLTC